MKQSRFLLLAIFLIMITACGMPKRETINPLPFIESEYNALPKSGTGIIKGQVFAKTVGGDVKKGAGNSVILFPATTFGTQRYKEQVIGGKLFSIAPDPRHSEYILEQTTDGDGRFVFRNVPPGKYYALSDVIWKIPYISSYGYTTWVTQGGEVHKEVEIQNDQTQEIVLTR